MDRKWTDEQRRTVVRAVIVEGLSLSVAGKLVQDANGRPMPPSTVKLARDRLGDDFMLADSSGAHLRLEQLQRQCARRVAELAVSAIGTGRQSAAEAKQLAVLERTAAALARQAQALRSMTRPSGPGKPAPKRPPDDDGALAAILGG